jgi:hypothetical protein
MNDDVMSNLIGLYFIDDLFTYGLDFFKKINKLSSLLTYSYDFDKKMKLQDIIKQDHDDYLIRFCCMILSNFLKGSINDSGCFTGLYYKDKITESVTFYTENIDSFIPEENKEFYKKSIAYHLKPHYESLLEDVKSLNIDKDFLKIKTGKDITSDNYEDLSEQYKQTLQDYIEKKIYKKLKIR